MDLMFSPGPGVNHPGSSDCVLVFSIETSHDRFLSTCRPSGRLRGVVRRVQTFGQFLVTEDIVWTGCTGSSWDHTGSPVHQEVKVSALQFLCCPPDVAVNKVTEQLSSFLCWQDFQNKCSHDSLDRSTLDWTARGNMLSL